MLVIDFHGLERTKLKQSLWIYDYMVVQLYAPGFQSLNRSFVAFMSSPRGAARLRGDCAQRLRQRILRPRMVSTISLMFISVFVGSSTVKDLVRTTLFLLSRQITRNSSCLKCPILSRTYFPASSKFFNTLFLSTPFASGAGEYSVIKRKMKSHFSFVIPLILRRSLSVALSTPSKTRKWKKLHGYRLGVFSGNIGVGASAPEVRAAQNYLYLRDGLLSLTRCLLPSAIYPSLR